MCFNTFAEFDHLHPGHKFDLFSAPDATSYDESAIDSLLSCTDFLGDTYTVSYSNYNNSCHISTFLELAYTTSTYCPGYLLSVCRPELRDLLEACFAAQAAVDCSTPASMSESRTRLNRSRDQFLSALSVFTGTPVGDQGNVAANWYTTFTGPGLVVNRTFKTLATGCERKLVKGGRASLVRPFQGANLFNLITPYVIEYLDTVYDDEPRGQQHFGVLDVLNAFLDARVAVEKVVLKELQSCEIGCCDEVCTLQRLIRVSGAHQAMRP